MWYDKRTMQAIFYTGAMLALIGVGLWRMGTEDIGIALTVVGAVMIVLGFWGIKVHRMVESEFRKRRRRRKGPSSQ